MRPRPPAPSAGAAQLRARPSVPDCPVGRSWVRSGLSCRVGATRNFDHRRLADLDSRTKTVIERAARPDRLSDQRADRSSLSREGQLQLARDHDRRTVMRNKLKIKARARKANPADHSLDDDEPAVAAPQAGQIGRLDHGEIAVAPYPQRRPARAVLDREPLGGAAAGLELRPDAGQ